MRLALYQPDIAGNVGTLMRLAACMDVGLDLIEPMGFPFGDRAMARAAMDYGVAASIRRHADFDAFVASVPGRIVLLTTRGATPLPDMTFQPGDTLLLGSEGAGVPAEVHHRADARGHAVAQRRGVRCHRPGRSASPDERLAADGPVPRATGLASEDSNMRQLRLAGFTLARTLLLTGTVPCSTRNLTLFPCRPTGSRNSQALRPVNLRASAT